MSPVTKCRYFNGYKPCGKSENCNSGCPSKDIPQISIVIVHLGAMGAVLRSTALLAPIKRKYPSSRITWITEAPMNLALQGNPRIDHVLTCTYKDLLIAKSKEYDVGFVIDKSNHAAGIAQELQIDQIFGFVADLESGGIIPANSEALELWKLGLNDFEKFHKNQKTENQLTAEALDLVWQRDEYDLRLSPTELKLAQVRKNEWKVQKDQPVLGFNTGCGPLMPAKKWTVEFHREVIQALLQKGLQNIVLLGGPEDELRNQQIAQGLPVFLSPATSGLRDGMVSVQAVDVMITGDSLGMHLGIALKSFVIAWFGPSCAVEIDLYDRGEKLLTQSSCSPCWKKDCQKKDMCYDQVSLQRVLESIDRGVEACQNPSYLSRQPSWETSF